MKTIDAIEIDVICINRVSTLGEPSYVSTMDDHHIMAEALKNIKGNIEVYTAEDEDFAAYAYDLGYREGEDLPVAIYEAEVVDNNLCSYTVTWDMEPQWEQCRLTGGTERAIADACRLKHIEIVCGEDIPYRVSDLLIAMCYDCPTGWDLAQLVVDNWRTLEGAAEILNAVDDWDYGIIDAIIEANGWNDRQVIGYDDDEICDDGSEYLFIGEDGRAKVAPIKD